MTTAREASLDWTRRALAEELRDHTASIGTRAENLVAIAERYHVPTEELILWIHADCAGRQWSAAEFRRYCEEYAELRKKLGLEEQTG